MALRAGEPIRLLHYNIDGGWMINIVGKFVATGSALHKTLAGGLYWLIYGQQRCRN
jgi:hypothetical protein